MSETNMRSSASKTSRWFTFRGNQPAESSQIFKQNQKSRFSFSQKRFNNSHKTSRSSDFFTLVQICAFIEDFPQKWSKTLVFPTSRGQHFSSPLLNQSGFMSSYNKKSLWSTFTGANIANIPEEPGPLDLQQNFVLQNLPLTVAANWTGSSAHLIKPAADPIRFQNRWSNWILQRSGYPGDELETLAVVFPVISGSFKVQKNKQNRQLVLVK